MDRFLAIDAFVRVAETRSFAEAARQMRVSRSVVTARIQQLEEFVGAPLFHRNTRSVRLSDLGETFLRDCVDLVGRTREVVDQMRDITTSPTGRLRVHALPGFVLGHLMHLLNDFLQPQRRIACAGPFGDAMCRLSIGSFFRFKVATPGMHQSLPINQPERSPGRFWRKPFAGHGHHQLIGNADGC